VGSTTVRITLAATSGRGIEARRGRLAAPRGGFFREAKRVRFALHVI
jgi:hypothetical protein